MMPTPGAGEPLRLAIVLELHERRPLLPIALSLVVVGTIGTAIALLPGPRSSGSGFAGIGIAVITFLAIGLLVKLHSSRHQFLVSDYRDTSATDRGWAIAVLVMAVLLCLGMIPWGLAEVRSGMPRAAGPIGALSSLMTAVGALLAVVAISRPRSWPMTHLAPAARCAAGAVVLLAMGTGAATRWPERTTEADEIDTPAVPSAVGEVAWRWDAPGHVREVVAAGAGVVVLVRDGVVALDGTTGAPRWEYRRRGALTRGIAAGADGATVAVHFGGSGPGRDRSLAVSLDAMTGDVHETEPVPVDLGWQLSIPTTRTAMIGTVERKRIIAAVDLESLEERWRWELPYGCSFDHYEAEPQFAAALDVVLTTYYCVRDPWKDASTVQGEVVLLALDERTGQQRWRHAVSYDRDVQVFDAAELAEYSRELPSYIPERVLGGRPMLQSFLQTSADRRAVLLDTVNLRGAGHIDYPAVVFDASTGKQLWRGERDGGVTEAFDSRAIERSRPAESGPRVSVRRELATGATYPGAISRGLCRSGPRPDDAPRSTGVVGQSFIESCPATDSAHGRRAWRLEVSSWPRPGLEKVLDIRLTAGRGAAKVHPIGVTSAPGAVAVHVRADWGPPAGDGEAPPATDSVFGLR